MGAVAQGENRGSLTSLPDLLNRATKLHDVLSTGRTVSILDNGSSRFPAFGRDSGDILEEGGTRRAQRITTSI